MPCPHENTPVLGDELGHHEEVEKPATKRGAPVAWMERSIHARRWLTQMLRLAEPSLQHPEYLVVFLGWAVFLLAPV